MPAADARIVLLVCLSSVLLDCLLVAYSFKRVICVARQRYEAFLWLLGAAVLFSPAWPLDEPKNATAHSQAAFACIWKRERGREKGPREDIVEDQTKRGDANCWRILLIVAACVVWPAVQWLLRLN